jgi:blue copper oxidase
MLKERLLFCTTILFLLGTMSSSFQKNSGSPMELPIPKLLMPDAEGRFVLTAMRGSLELSSGVSDTFGYNGSYLGPTLRAGRGEEVNIVVKNQLDEDTTLHWHGMHVPAEFDGGPHQVIASGDSWNPRFTIDQTAATLWYHPHLMGKTAEHVYRGLAGIFILDDEYSDSLNIPQSYGVNDIPLILQDRDIGRNGEFRYAPSMPDIMHGYKGNTLLVNGVEEPLFRIVSGTYRFRILNGSNSSIHRISFSDNRTFSVIASDGGFLPRVVTIDSLLLSPGERFEILVDFHSADKVTFDCEGDGVSYTALNIETEGEGEFFLHPKQFNYEPLKPGSNWISRNFLMETQGMGRFTINGAEMDMSKISFSVKKGQGEIWNIMNRGMGMMNLPHSFHVHDVQFTILSINGKDPPPLLQGPKDTILIPPGYSITIAFLFKDYTGIYMYHCHFLEHEDAGMMGQFLVQD